MAANNATATQVRAVCVLNAIPGIATVDFKDPRNNDLNRDAVSDFLLTGGARHLLPDEIWLDNGRFVDVVWIEGPGFFVSDRLRRVLDRAAPDDLDFHPVRVRGEQWWLMRVVTVLNAAKLRRGAPRDAPGNAYRFNWAVWKLDVLTRPAIFRIAQVPTSLRMTDSVAIAYLNSGYPGLLVAGPSGEVPLARPWREAH